MLAWLCLCLTWCVCNGGWKCVCACVGDVYLWFGLIHSGLEQQASIMSHSFQTYVCCHSIHKSSHSVIVDCKKESEHTETFSQFLLRVLNFHCFHPGPWVHLCFLRAILIDSSVARLPCLLFSLIQFLRIFSPAECSLFFWKVCALWNAAVFRFCLT